MSESRIDDPNALLARLTLWLAAHGYDAPSWVAENLPELADEAAKIAFGDGKLDGCTVLWNGQRLPIMEAHLRTSTRSGNMATLDLSCRVP